MFNYKKSISIQFFSFLKQNKIDVKRCVYESNYDYDLTNREIDRKK